jgi:hypothetical protein
MNPCPNVLPAHADMWERMCSLVQSEQLIADFVPQHTVLYTNTVKKAQLLANVAQDRHSNGVVQLQTTFTIAMKSLF